MAQDRRPYFYLPGKSGHAEPPDAVKWHLDDSDIESATSELDALIQSAQDRARRQGPPKEPRRRR